ncbi:exodeoxyribonuclease III [Cereibacter sp. SYSU M97828]|nr:exodeoxyribonuclease III [Cereibacter flavus]
MKIATWNINGVNGRLPLLLDWLEAAKPDVVCLQELKAAPARFPAAALSRAGYEAVWAGEKSWNGVAILARGATPIATRRALPGDPRDTEARYIEAAVDGVLIASLYVPNGNPVEARIDRKRRWVSRFLKHAEGLIGYPAILAGDFNIIPEERDVYNPARWEGDALFLPEMRESFAALLQQGWLDSLRRLQPEADCFTFWDYKRNAWKRNAGLRLDHILVSPVISGRLQAADVDREMRGKPGASDHAPVWASISTAAKGHV